MLIPIQEDNIVFPNLINASSASHPTLTTTGILGKDQICYAKVNDCDSAFLFLKVNSNAYYTKTNYPNLVKLFEKLQVKYEKSNMSFSVSVKDSNIEYSGSGLKGLFSNKYNFFNLYFIKMIKEILTFYKKANNINAKDFENQTLGEFLKYKKMSNYFIKFHIIPMVSAIWSTPAGLANEMPMSLFINFFQNHGLFKIKNRPQWYTVSGRSKTYVSKILKTISGEYFKNYKITKV